MNICNPRIYYALFAVGILAASSVEAGFYRWTESNGEIAYSDVVPPAVSQKGHSELNHQGMVVKTIAAAPTSDQIAEQKRRETLGKLRDTLHNYQQEQDDYLLANYADVNELEAVFKSKLSLLSQSSRSLQERRGALLQRLQAVKAQLAKMTEPAEHTIMQTYIQQAQETLANYDYALQENQTEQDRLRQKYEQERVRLAELLKASPLSPRPDPSKAPVGLHAELARQ